jgi:beta-lactamase regulating signal transducer with metallopeptidase domain
MTDLPVVFVWGLKATPIFLGAWIVTALLRRQSAATRHFVWVLATGCALVLPLATSVAPRLEVALPAFQPASPAPLAFDAPGGLPAPAAPTGSARTSGIGLTASSAETAPSAPSTPAAWAALATPVWATGAALLLLLVGISMWRAARLAAKARPLTVVGVAREAAVLARTLGIRRPVHILEADRGAMPMTWGALRPRLLVPDAFATWPAPRRRAVLLHELAHVKRWDWLTQLAARLACALYWWHPLAWVAARRLREERELACDDLVLAHGTVASTYAADLLEIARAFRVSPATALAGVAMARRSQLAGRLLAVLDAARSRRSLGRGQALSATAAAVVVLLPIAGLAAGSDPLEADLSADGENAAALSSAAPARTVTASSLATSQPPRLPTQSRSAMLCDWAARSGSSSSSTSINDERMMIQISRDDCTITVRAEGDLVFSDDDRDLSRVSNGGFFEIEERTGRARRRVEIAEEGGQLQRRWFVDGREQSYGDDARAWLGDALLVLARRAGINAEARAIRILTTQGEDGLIAEIALLQSDHVAGQYYRVLFERGKLSSAQVSRLLADAGGRIESDHELGRVLATVAARGPMDASVQRAYVHATDGLDSDHEHGQALQGLVTAGTLDAATLDAMLISAGRIESDHTRAGLLVTVAQRYPADRTLPASYLTAVDDMRSDYERGRVLTQLLERDDVSAAERARVLGVVSRIDSDHTRSEVLIGIAAEGPLDAVTRDAFFAAVRGMGSDHSRQQVLQAALAAQADEATILAVLEAVRGLSSDHSKAELLTAVATKGRMSDRVRTAYASVAQTIGSRYERDRAMQAAGLQGA